MGGTLPRTPADYSFGSTVISHPRNIFMDDLNTFTDGYSSAGVCNESADVRRDGIFQVYLWQRQQLDVTWPDVWYPAAEAGASRADTVCFYLTTDARMTPGSCVGANCGQNTEFGLNTTFVAEETGWHYLVCDYDATPSSWFMGANVCFAEATLWLVCDSWGIGARPFTLVGSIIGVTGSARTPCSAPGPAASSRTPAIPGRTTRSSRTGRGRRSSRSTTCEDGSYAACSTRFATTGEPKGRHGEVGAS